MESLTVKDIVGNDSKSVKTNQQEEESVPFLGPTLKVNMSPWGMIAKFIIIVYVPSVYN